jgi:hypothetical protein
MEKLTCHRLAKAKMMFLAELQHATNGFVAHRLLGISLLTGAAASSTTLRTYSSNAIPLARAFDRRPGSMYSV